jgi:hypothetical protein
LILSLTHAASWNLSGIAMLDDRQFLIVEENRVGPNHPFSGEKAFRGACILEIRRKDRKCRQAS